MSYVIILRDGSRSLSVGPFRKAVLKPNIGTLRPDVCWIFTFSTELLLVGIAYASPRQVRSAKERIIEEQLSVDHIQMISPALRLSEIFSEMIPYVDPETHLQLRGFLETSRPGHAEQLSNRQGYALERIAVSRRDDIAQILETVRQLAGAKKIPFTGSAADIWQLERDAMLTALRAAGFSSSILAAWSPPESADDPFSSGLNDIEMREAGDLEEGVAAARRPTPIRGRLSLADLTTPSEQSLIEADSRVMPGWISSGSENLRHDVQSFDDGNGHVLEIFNVNATPIESRLGVDLLYFYRNANSLVGVQYKKLKSSDDVIYVDARLEDQISRMSRWTEECRVMPTEPAHWRIGDDWMYLKLAEATPMYPDTPRLMGGPYLPLSYLLLILEDPAILGPKKGKRLGPGLVKRHVTGTLFIDLLKRNWIGSPSLTEDRLKEMMQVSLQRGNSVVVGIDYRP
ncbi:hypothetical protein [Actinomadura sp. K4S16]|uniref:hypothetical protein n=1 Tax=Actinomadura sp. K4S16 TaxID=1316147 RepID=UPI0011EDEDD7|nr:hypothetical protein [Actinomadura sp. K4S16]